MDLRKGDRVICEGITGTVTLVDERRGRVRVDFENDAVGFFDREDDVQLTFITTSNRSSSKWAQVKDCLRSFREMQVFREEFLAAHASWAGNQPSRGHAACDAAMADYKAELAYLGERLADAVAEVFGMELPTWATDAKFKNGEIESNSKYLSPPCARKTALTQIGALPAVQG